MKIVSRESAAHSVLHVYSQWKARFRLKSEPKCDIISKGSLLGIGKIHAVW
jgi:hypothetical protein